jgi:hypothetical protein
MVDSLDGIVASQEHGWAAFLLPRSLRYSTQPFLQRTKVRASEARGHLLLSSITLFPYIVASEQWWLLDNCSGSLYRQISATMCLCCYGLCRRGLLL